MRVLRNAENVQQGIIRKVVLEVVKCANQDIILLVVEIAALVNHVLKERIGLMTQQLYVFLVLVDM